MNLRIKLASILTLALFPLQSFAQFDSRPPGIYAIVEGKSVPIPFTPSYTSATYGISFESNPSASHKNGETCFSVTASNLFVLVTDPDKTVYLARDPFVKEMTPENLIFIPLTVNPEKPQLELNSDMYIDDIISVIYQKGGLEFEWEQISSNSYLIKVKGLMSGEYGISFRPSPTTMFDLRLGVFGFTIPKGYLEDRLTEANAANMEYLKSPVTLVSEPVKHLGSDVYQNSNWEIQVGYVNKSWIAAYQSGTRREDFFGDSQDKFFHGFSIGPLFTPSFNSSRFGLRTGMLLEFYYSRSKWLKDFSESFGEVDMYVPLHASYCIPFNQVNSLSFYVGAGFQWAMIGSYNKMTGTSLTGIRPAPVLKSHIQEYGNGWPNRLNCQAEFGLNFRYDRFGFNFTYGLGLVNHSLQNSFDEGKTFETASRARQDKMQASISFLLF